jgi:YfiH family protein
VAAGVSAHPADWKLAGGIMVRSTGCAQGDMSGDDPVVERRRRAAVDADWTVLRQVHGPRVVVVDHPGGASGEAADAAVTAKPGAALAVLTADCAPIGLGSPEGVLGVVHAGWKGLRAGVVESAVTEMRRLGATRIEAVLGPCIHPCCYAFGDEDLQDMAARYGESVRGSDAQGSPALNLPAAVRTALHNAGARLVGEVGACTGCSGRYWSWRKSSTPRRQATVVWRP